MRRKNKRVYKLEVIVPALLFIPPLGLYLLWKSPRSGWAKLLLSVALIMLFAVLGAAAVKTGYYQSMREPPIPDSGFDVSRDSRGAYTIDRVLPFERRVFNEIVHEMRRLQKEQGYQFTQTDARAMEAPQDKAIDIVAVRHALDRGDCEAIYLKVSSKLSLER